MLDFLVVGLPRSGTAWASNWLTNGSECLCVHDYIFEGEIPNVKVGSSNTISWEHPESINSLDIPKVILHRDIEEIKVSLHSLDIQVDMGKAEKLLNELEGVHVDYECMFVKETAEVIWKHLIGTEMDVERHNILIKLNVQSELAYSMLESKMNETT